MAVAPSFPVYGKGGAFCPAFEFVFAENRAFAAAFEVAVSPISNLKFEISVAVAVAFGVFIKFKRIVYSHSCNTLLTCTSSRCNHRVIRPMHSLSAR